MLFHLNTLSLYLRAVGNGVLTFIGNVQTVSTTHRNFCHTGVNKHTIIASHLLSTESELLDTLLVPILIVTSTTLPGCINSTSRYSWATVASPNAITLMIHEVLKFYSTFTRLSTISNVMCREVVVAYLSLESKLIH